MTKILLLSTWALGICSGLLVAVTDVPGASAIGLAGGGLGVILLAVINGYWSDRKEARSHEIEKLRVEKRCDENTEALIDLFEYAERMHEWTKSIQGACPTVQPAPKPPDLPRWSDGDR